MAMTDAADIDRSIPFVETHHHLWERDRLSYDWLDEERRPKEDTFLGDYKAIRADWGPGRLFREFYGQNVIRSIHVEAAMSGPDPVAETAWLAEVSAAHGMPNAYVVACDLAAPDSAEQLDRHLGASALVRGVRDVTPVGDDPSAFHAGMRAMRDRGLIFDLNPPHGDTAAGLDVVSAVPDLEYVIGHCAGAPVLDAEAWQAWAAAMTELGRHESVSVKISGLGMFDHAWTIESIRPTVLHCIEAFGTARSMFGTNWPVDALYGSYYQTVDAYRVILAEAGFSREEQHALLHGNAERIYRI